MFRPSAIGLSLAGRTRCRCKTESVRTFQNIRGCHPELSPYLRLEIRYRFGGLQFRFGNQACRVVPEMARGLLPMDKSRKYLKLSCLSAKVIGRLGNPFVLHARNLAEHYR